MKCLSTETRTWLEKIKDLEEQKKWNNYFSSKFNKIFLKESDYKQLEEEKKNFGLKCSLPHAQPKSGVRFTLESQKLQKTQFTLITLLRDQWDVYIDFVKQLKEAGFLL